MHRQDKWTIKASWIMDSTLWFSILTIFHRFRSFLNGMIHLFVFGDRCARVCVCVNTHGWNIRDRWIRFATMPTISYILPHRVSFAYIIKPFIACTQTILNIHTYNNYAPSSAVLFGLRWKRIEKKLVFFVYFLCAYLNSDHSTLGMNWAVCNSRMLFGWI